MLEAIDHPWYLRLADRAHARLPVPRLEADPEVFRTLACRQTGLSDFGDPGFEEGLEVLCRSAEEDADFNVFGRLLFRQWVVGALVQRLRRVALQRTQPAIFERPLNRPLIVGGLPRSGTTYLHRLLALGPTARPLLSWELHEPIPGPGPDLRRVRTRILIAQAKRAAPQIDAKHHLDADKPEECVLLQDDSMESFTYWMFFPVFGYLEWLKTRDPAPAYAAYRAYLQIFQAQDPSRRLVLKAPIHAAHLEALRAAVPEAVLVQTHRDPIPVMGSINSLFHSIHGIMSRSRRPEEVGRANLEVMAWTMDRCLAQRSALPQDAVLDVTYDALVADPVGTVRAISDHAGLEVDEAAVARWVAGRPQHHYGRHVYSLEEHGLTASMVRARFADYTERFSV